MIDHHLLASVLAVLAALGAFGLHIYANSLAIQCWWANLCWTVRSWFKRGRA